MQLDPLSYIYMYTPLGPKAFVRNSEVSLFEGSLKCTEKWWGLQKCLPYPDVEGCQLCEVPLYKSRERGGGEGGEGGEREEKRWGER